MTQTGRPLMDREVGVNGSHTGDNDDLELKKDKPARKYKKAGTPNGGGGPKEAPQIRVIEASVHNSPKAVVVEPGHWQRAVVPPPR